MRARQKKRQRMRRVTIVVTLLVIAVSLGVGIYFASTQGQSALDKYINKPVSETNMASLLASSAQPYGPAPTSTMQTAVDNYGGARFTSAGKPTIVYIGAEYCEFCALERWAMIVALNRFGNFSNLHYMTSSAADGDLPTFTFLGSSYKSSYISFRPFEAADRGGAALQTVPSNYTSVWNSFGSGFPFLDFANTYVLKGSLLAFPSELSGRDWNSTLKSISISDSFGLEMREAANMMTAIICKVTGNEPASVCTAPPINTATSSIAGPSQGTLTTSPGSLRNAGTPNLSLPMRRES